MIEEFQRSGAKGLYVFRDLRDVATSTITKYGVTFAQLWDSRFLHRCLANERRWTALPGVLVSQYEEMVADLTTEVGRIADHLGLTVSRTRCAEVAADYGLERQRARIVEARRGGRLLRQGFLGAQFDPYTNLHTDHIATGRVGTWQSCLSLTEVAVIEDWARHWLRAHGYALTVGQPQRSLRRLLYAGGRFTFRLLARSKRAARARAPA
jgi:hypothetical protein